MTLNELLAEIGKIFAKFFYWLGNTPLEELASDIGAIIVGILGGAIAIIFVIFIFNVFIFILGKILNKIFPSKEYKATPLEKQSMYIMGKKLKKILSKKKK